MNLKSFEKIINEAWQNKNQVSSKSEKKIIKVVNETIKLLDQGKIRVAEKKNNQWSVNQWIKKAILLSFRTNEMKKTRAKLLRDLGEKQLSAYLETLIGKEKIVLIEKNFENYSVGKTQEYAPIRIEKKLNEGELFKLL